MEVWEWELVYYVTEDGRNRFREWFESFRDFNTQVMIDARLRRMSSGNFGNCKTVGSGVFELKIDEGPGYRVYFAKVNRKIILLFCGGDKATQSKDIQRAHLFWHRFKEKQK